MASGGFQYVTGRNCYVLIRSPNDNQQIWSTVAVNFVTFNGANYTDYDIPATEQGTTGYYTYPVPVLPAGTFDVAAVERLGGSPAQADLPIGVGGIEWNGTAFNTLTDVVLAVAAGLQTGLPESYRTTGGTGSAAQLLYELIAHMGNASITGTLKTLKKLNQATNAKTYTLNSAASPTAVQEAS